MDKDADIEFVLGHALYLSSVRGGKHKNDKKDSNELADCLPALKSSAAAT